MIGGLGVDIVEIGRMRSALERHPQLRERLFSPDERDYCESRNRPEVHYALRFAAKEAVLKALGTGFSGMCFSDVEVARDARGRPVPVLHGRAAEVAREAGIVQMHLSLSYTHSTAVASAVAMTDPDGREQPEAPHLRQQRVFRESRAILDEMAAD